MHSKHFLHQLFSSLHLQLCSIPQQHAREDTEGIPCRPQGTRPSSGQLSSVTSPCASREYSSTAHLHNLQAPKSPPHSSSDAAPSSRGSFACLGSLMSGFAARLLRRSSKSGNKAAALHEEGCSHMQGTGSNSESDQRPIRRQSPGLDEVSSCC